MRFWVVVCALIAWGCVGCADVEAEVPDLSASGGDSHFSASENLSLATDFDFSVQDGGIDSQGRVLQDHCVKLAPIPGKGRADGLMEVICRPDGLCSEVFFFIPEGFACKDGTFIRLPSKPVSLPAGSPTACRGVIPGHNDPRADRFNLVFVGSDYHQINLQRPLEGLAAFLWDIRAILGEGSRRGFFDYEPFKQRKNRFNLWYVETFTDMDPVTQPYGYQEHEARNTKGDADARVLVQACAAEMGLKKVKMVHLAPNRGNLDSSITIATFRETQLFNPTDHQSCREAVSRGVSLMLAGDEDGCLTPEDNPPDGHPDSVSFAPYKSGLDYDGDGKSGDPADRNLFSAITRLVHRVDLCEGTAAFNETIQNACANGLSNLGRALSHGSTLAHELGHHFLAYDARNIAASPDAGWEQVTVGNCFIGPTRQSCLENAPWRDLIGDGCGQLGVEDCNPLNPDYALEIGCFEGCIAGVTSFRSVRAGSYEYGIPGQSGSSRRELGLWNEEYLGKAVDGILLLQ